MEQLQIGRIKLTWLRGGVNHLDGGAMFGVVPKPLWSKKYPCNEKNQIELRTDPILVQSEGKNLLIDSGMGQGKLTEKQLKNFGVLEESKIESCLQELGLTCQDIDYVLMTHLHFDHASGLTKEVEQGKFEAVFPRAKHIVSRIEWEEMQQPNIRSRNTYWKQNWEAIKDLVEPFEQQIQITSEVTMYHTGGHSAGHSIVRYESAGDQGIHFGDLMPTHAHQNPLWVLAYDDYPMDSIFAKEKWVKEALDGEWWVTFYHDAYYRAIKWNAENEQLEQVKRIRPE
ncbi:YtnP family quorum-quenching lactonase [Bacillus horti]|uniref:Glyoxylase-like metal-dependent hydrolase (Beta-lactamase superfamily II) n=1 Tax=Caldalkalibacillus horti TaxID=77523 RepID=A0ABT9VWT3_9BACI|nr:MBL fold metallo-hydrolase [Bacillus horti]MDQ0165448.1 glyoxylase-like metal-dependent hydrolase (beta-lactamase superfamily II) [Bacillus horti]